MKVKIMTKAINEKHLVTGATLVFDTIRTGYPNAEIECFDNTKDKDLSCRIEASCNIVDAKYIQLQTEKRPWTWMEEQVYSEKGKIIFVDADIMFWENCEEWNFKDALFAGRYIPTYYEPLFNGYCFARVHPSLFIIPNVEKMVKRIDEARKKHWVFDPFSFYSFKTAGKWVYYDTLACLTNVFQDEAFIFEQEHLDCYDHLFGGHMAEAVADLREAKDKEAYLSWLEAARSGNIDKLKGIWLDQEIYYRKVAI